MSTFNLQILVKAIDESSGELRKQGESVKSLAAQVAVASGILVGFGATAKEVFEFGQEGAQLDRLALAGDNLAASMGGSMDDIVTSVKRASMGMVSEADIIGASNRAMMLGLGGDAETMASLMETATFRARAMGISTTQAYDDIITGIGRASPQILDNLGIVLDTATIYGDWAVKIGVAEDALTKAQQTQALTAAVVADGNAQIEAAGGLALDAAGEYEALLVAWSDFTNKMKQDTAHVLTPAVQALRLLTTWNQNLLQALLEQEIAVRDTSTTYAEYRQALDAAAAATDYSINAEGDLVEVMQVRGRTVEKLIEADYALDEAQWLVAYSADEVARSEERVAYQTAMAQAAIEGNTIAGFSNAEAMDFASAALREAGLSADEMRKAEDALALALGEVTVAELLARDAAMDLATQYAEGKITAEEYATRIGELQETINAMDTTGGMEQVNLFREALDRIPREIEVEFRTRRRTGERESRRHQQGGWTTGAPIITSERGPELIVPPPGSAVYPHASRETQEALRGGKENHYHLTVYTQAKTSSVIQDFQAMRALM